MASLNLGAASSINESWVVFGSSLKLRVGFRSKRFRRVAERWRFRAQQMSVKEQRTKQELARSAKRSESLRQILKQYGISVENPEENMTSSRLDDLNRTEKHEAVPSFVIDEDDSKMKKHPETEAVSGRNHHNCEHEDFPSSVIDDSKMNTTDELPDSRRQEKYYETVNTTEDVSGNNFPHLTGALFTSSLLPVLGFCMLCIVGTLYIIITRKPARGQNQHGSKRTRWRTALSDLNDPLASEEHQVGSEYQEVTDEEDEACSKVELEYKRFLLECGLE